MELHKLYNKIPFCIYLINISFPPHKTVFIYVVTHSRRSIKWLSDAVLKQWFPNDFCSSSFKNNICISHIYYCLRLIQSWNVSKSLQQVSLRDGIVSNTGCSLPFLRLCLHLVWHHLSTNNTTVLPGFLTTYYNDASPLLSNMKPRGDRAAA